MGFRTRARAERELLKQAELVLEKIREADKAQREAATYQEAVVDELRDTALRRTGDETDGER